MNLWAFYLITGVHSKIAVVQRSEAKYGRNLGDVKQAPWFTFNCQQMV